MCGSGGGGGQVDEYTAEQRQQQEKRENRIRSGLAQIKALFEGGTYGTNPATEYNPNQIYYDAEGNVIKDFLEPAKTAPTPSTLINAPADRRSINTPVAFNPTEAAAAIPRSGSPSSGRGGALGGALNKLKTKLENDEPVSTSGSAITRARDTVVANQQQDALDEAAANPTLRDDLGQIFTGKATTPGFNDEFYNSRRKAYLDYANPQVDEQYGDALEQLTYALSRAGTLNSSVAADRFADTEKGYRTARRQVADAANDEANQARRAVADERTRLTQLVQATGDPSASLAGVGDILQTLRTQPSFSPVGPIFQNVTAGIGNFAQGQRYADLQRRLDDLFRQPSQSSARTVN